MDSRPGGRLSLDRTRHIAPQIADYLREQIMSIELVPGTPISRAALQQQFGLSQTPVRDALQKLEEEGLITVYPQHATLVSKIDMSLSRQIHFMRRAIESDAVRLLAEKPQPEIIRALRTANENLSIMRDRNDAPEFQKADKAFHRTIFDHARILDVWQILQRKSGHLDRVRLLALPSLGMSRVVRLHDQIVDCIEGGDGEAAAAAMREHMSRTPKMGEMVAEIHPEYVENASGMARSAT
ncbi:DNA-binding transcriptional regulator, GntR family [Palleronia marisminoris]|uniref:Putative HTH-type transcriptional regulator YdfH n=1 Tax=Palleronia marisminoris TaxID=315423 RepID=A0A1Y5SNR1_9RHOB|nr:GntR family transcriptional regulator [Palleronia marisminoris]SFG92812.1 DNA-binding transcriptional regulator, GntR family [Palleronia marisminoris]SLN44926.1 putative HTH-type transcriptional regulator YdfH [Palleronia marisminoris]